MKHKQSAKPVIPMAQNDSDTVENFRRGYVECENPNEMLYRFEGTLIVDGNLIPLSVD